MKTVVFFMGSLQMGTEAKVARNFLPFFQKSKKINLKLLLLHKEGDLFPMIPDGTEVLSLDESMHTNLLRIIPRFRDAASFSMGSVSLEQYKAAIAALENFNAAVQTKRTELTGLMNQRDDQALQMKELVTRARSTIRGFFGPNSSQYDEAGGTAAD